MGGWGIKFFFLKTLRVIFSGIKKMALNTADISKREERDYRRRNKNVRSNSSSKERERKKKKSRWWRGGLKRGN